MSTLARLSGIALDGFRSVNGSTKPNINTINGQNLTAATGVVSSGLVMHLDAGDSQSYSGTGTAWNDLTSNNVDFSLINSPTYSSTDGGGSFQFDGVDDEIRSSYSASSPILFSASDLDTNGATFQLWAKNVSGHNVQFNTNSASTNHYYGIEVIPTSHPTFGQRFGAHIFEGSTLNSQNDRRTAVSSWGTHSANTWYLFTFTFSSNESSGIGFYLNTSSVAVASTSGNGNDTSPGYTSSRAPAMGSVRGATKQGYVSQVLVYDRVLSSTEVTQNFNADKSRYGYP